MKKTIRRTYPVEFSVGLLILIFILSFFLSSQLFDARWRDLIDGTNPSVYLGMFLISCAVIVMVLIIWEEFLFPIKVKHVAGGVVFRNHQTKLNTQLLIYCLIPAVFIFVYTHYVIHEVRFFIWATVCIIVPVIAKLMSGLKNYNDFLSLTDKSIDFKNNQKSGSFPLKGIQRITVVRDEHNVLHKLNLQTTQHTQTIDLDEMELEAFLDSIDEFITGHYKGLLA